MPLGLITGRAFSPFSRAFSSRSAAISCFSAATSPRSAATSASSSQRDRLEGSAGAAMTTATSYATASLQAKNASHPGVLPRFLHYVDKAFTAGELSFFAEYRHLQEPAAFRRY